MRKRIKTMLSAFLAASMLAGVLAVSAVPASAVDAEIEAPLTVKATSNYFPCSENKYYGLSEFEDENGDALGIQYVRRGPRKKSRLLPLCL